MATQTELYRFSEQDEPLPWLFTSGDEDVTYALETYEPSKIRRSDIESRNEMARANLDITVPLTEAAGIKWLTDNGERIVTLTIFQRNRLGAYKVAWKGRLAGVVPGMDAITLKMESIFTSLRRTGLRARYQRSCRHPLYGRGCNLNAEDFAIPGAVSAITETVVTVAEAAAHPDGYFIGGMLRSPDGILSFIIEHIGTSLRLQRLSYSLQVAAAGGLPFDVQLYPGCPHSRSVCDSRFGNLLNYGGFDFIPKKNPMGGSSIV